MAKRTNRAIELLSVDQPVYYIGAHSGHVLTYERGKEDAGTWADYINVGMEHGAFDMAGLDHYLQGMVDAGPTRSGHRTPAVIVEAPVEGTSEDIIRFNAWQFRQILARGVHGIMLCQVTCPEAVQAFVESCRYPINKLGVGSGLGEGTRGVGSEGTATNIWGITPDEYRLRAEPWPLNPDGELMLGIKIESVVAIPHIEEILAVPGIGYAEMGPGDMSLSMGYRQRPDPWSDEMLEVNARVKAACLANSVAYHETLSMGTMQEVIDSGSRVFSAGNDELVKAGRAYTKRVLPV